MPALLGAVAGLHHARSRGVWEREDERQILEERAFERDFPRSDSGALSLSERPGGPRWRRRRRLTCAASPRRAACLLLASLGASGPRNEKKEKKRLLKLSLQITTVRTKEQQSWQSLKAGSRV